MRTACWLSILLSASTGCTDTTRRAAPGIAADQTTSQKSAPQAVRAAVVGSHNEDGQTRLDLIVDNRPETVLFSRDETVAPAADATVINLLAEVPGVALVLVDRYASIPGGLSMCQAGEEVFLRVVAIAGTVSETYTAKVASCRQDIELAEPGLRWDAPSSTLRIDWLSGPTGKPESSAIRIGPDGRVRPGS